MTDEKDKKAPEPTPAAPATGPTQPVVVQGQPLTKAQRLAQADLVTRPFRLRAGSRHIGSDGENVRDGEVVQLNARQAEAFADKFEPVVEKSAAEEDELTRLRKRVAELEGRSNTPTQSAHPGVPQDIGARTSIASEEALSVFPKDAIPGKTHAADKVASVGGETPLAPAGSAPVPANTTAVPPGSPATTAKETGAPSTTKKEKS